MVVKHRFALVVPFALLGLMVVAPPRALAQPPRRQPTPNDTLKSTEVAPDKKVTFRIYAPKAEEVSVGGDFGQGGKMTKDDQGVWSITVGPLTPDFYSYTFTVDGVRTVDPKNPMIKQGVVQPGQHVPRPGRGGRVRGDQDVPHGEVRAVWYRLGHARTSPAGCTSTRRPATRAGRDSTRSSTCCTAAATRTRAGARSAGPGSSSTT